MGPDEGGYVKMNDGDDDDDDGVPVMINDGQINDNGL